MIVASIVVWDELLESKLQHKKRSCFRFVTWERACAICYLNIVYRNITGKTGSRDAFKNNL